tara:strand:- start:1961 stop:2497 length:537 start_codon:yes stop_codon:yes gene_type:complete
MKKKILFFPFFLFIFITIIFFYLLLIDRNPSELPSSLINKKIPVFVGKSLFNGNIFVSKKEFGNQIILVNFFATWCGPCREEHSFIKKLSNKENLKIIGINYKDDVDKTILWLKELGNPYSDVIIDKDGSIGIEWGVYGIPETFVVDKNSKIKYKILGPINEKNYERLVLKIAKEDKE